MSSAPAWTRCFLRPRPRRHYCGWPDWASGSLSSGTGASRMCPPSPGRGLNGSTTGQASLATDIAAAAQAGFRYLELRDTKIEAWLRERSREALRAEFERAGGAPLSVNGLADAPPA